jgi:hypothetical protein
VPVNTCAERAAAGSRKIVSPRAVDKPRDDSRHENHFAIPKKLAAIPLPKKTLAIHARR